MELVNLNCIRKICFVKKQKTDVYEWFETVTFSQWFKNLFRRKENKLKNRYVRYYHNGYYYTKSEIKNIFNLVSFVNPWGQQCLYNISLPKPKTSLVEIKGADGVLDLSEVLTGDILYNNRVITLTFEMMDDTDYYDLISNISNYRHGRIVTISLTNDEDYYYVGRASISQWQCIKRQGIIVITVDAEPYKYAVTETTMIVNVANQTKTITLQNNRKRVCPMLNVTGTITLTINGVNYKLAEGKQQLSNFRLVEGNNVVKVSGNGTLTITYRQGEL